MEGGKCVCGGGEWVKVEAEKYADGGGEWVEVEGGKYIGGGEWVEVEGGGIRWWRRSMVERVKLGK